MERCTALDSLCNIQMCVLLHAQFVVGGRELSSAEQYYDVPGCQSVA